MHASFSDRLQLLLPNLRCPVSGNALRYIDSNDATDVLKDAGVDSSDISAVLSNNGGTVLYPIKGQIIDLRQESAIANETELPINDRSDESLDAKRNVQEWYDNFGWQRNDEGVLNDSAFYSQDGATPYGFYESQSHFALSELFTKGQLLLDAASGAIAHPEYLAYSANHNFRVCVDFSEAALREASVKVGERGFCVLADVCQLPFVDDVFDGVVSGYTVQHIHKDQQAVAIQELYRVLKPGYRLCLMATQDVGLAHRIVIRIARLLSKFFGARKTPFKTKSSGEPVTPPHQLYGHIWGFDWWRRTTRALSPLAKIRCLRILSDHEFDNVVSTRAGARRLRGLELMFSGLLARASSLIVVDIEKPNDNEHGRT